jgi:hypothetical protein
MAKAHSFADKMKKKKKADHITVKMVKVVKTEKGTYKFNEKFVQVEDLSKLASIK